MWCFFPRHCPTAPMSVPISSWKTIRNWSMLQPHGRKTNLFCLQTAKNRSVCMQDRQTMIFMNLRSTSKPTGSQRSRKNISVPVHLASSRFLPLPKMRFSKTWRMRSKISGFPRVSMWSTKKLPYRRCFRTTWHMMICFIWGALILLCTKNREKGTSGSGNRTWRERAFRGCGRAGAGSKEECNLSGTQYGDYTGGEFLCQKV